MCRTIALLTAFCIGIMPHVSITCTALRLKTVDDAVVWGRTLEFAKDIESNVLFVPRGYNFKGITPGCNGNTIGLQWSAKYAAVGANALQYIEIIDGVNEKGLSGGLLYLPAYAEYQQFNPEEQDKTIAPWQMLTWILTNCATVDDVKKMLPDIRVVSVVLPEWNMIPPLHAIIHDEAGDCIVVEYVAGKLNIHDNALGVLTNSPTFDWHVTNIRNYGNLSYLNVPKIKIADLTLSPFGPGAGMRNLPGDFTPPSRFIRAVAFTQSATEQKDETEAVDTAFHLLNLFDLPHGALRIPDDSGKLSIEYTVWTSVTDVKNRRYHFHTFNNRQVKRVDLMALNLDSTQHKIIPMKSKPIIEDITTQFGAPKQFEFQKSLEGAGIIPQA